MIPLALLGAGMGVLNSGFQLFQGMKNKREGERALNAFERQELTNVYEGMGVSTIGSDLMREESARTTSGLIDASRSGGIRGLMSAVPKIQAMNNTQNLQSRDYLDKQVQKRDYAEANDNVRIQQMQEQRDNQDLAGISAQIQAGREDMSSGLRGIGNSIISGIGSLSGEGSQDGGLNNTPPKTVSSGYNSSFYW